MWNYQHDQWNGQLNVIIQAKIQLAMIVHSYSEHENDNNTAEPLDSSSDEELESMLYTKYWTFV